MFVALGDLLAQMGELNAALEAYMKARQLSDSQVDIETRINRTSRKLEALGAQSP